MDRSQQTADDRTGFQEDIVAVMGSPTESTSPIPLLCNAMPRARTQRRYMQYPPGDWYWKPYTKIVTWISGLYSTFFRPWAISRPVIPASGVKSCVTVDLHGS